MRKPEELSKKEKKALAQFREEFKSWRSSEETMEKRLGQKLGNLFGLVVFGFLLFT